MENNENGKIRIILNGFIDDYAERDPNVEFSKWLSDKLQVEVQGADGEFTKNLADKIIEGILNGDKTSDELNQAVEDGKTKEKWFTDKMAEVCDGMDVQETGDVLSKMEYELSKVDENLLYGENENLANEYNQNDAPVEWNKYSVKDMLNRIARKLAVFSLGNIAKALENRARGVENDDVKDFEKNLFINCLKNNNSEVKAMIAGALEVVAQNKLDDTLPSDTPVEVICDLAGGVVDAAVVVVDFVDGNVTKMEAVDRIGRGGIAALCRGICHCIEMKVATIPCVGPIYVDLLGGLFEHMKGPVFADNVYKVFHDAAIATWEGLKDKFTQIRDTVENVMRRQNG